MHERCEVCGGTRRTEGGQVDKGEASFTQHTKTYQTAQLLELVFLDAFPASERLYPLVYHSGVCLR
jgi:hypothetical protein